MRIQTILACGAVVASANIFGGACGGRTMGGVDFLENARDGGEDAFATGGRSVVQPGPGGRSSGGTGGRSTGGSGGQTCSSSQTSCGGSCVNLASNVNHCGSCFNTCSSGYSCVAGQCRSSGSTECLPSETYCSNWGYCMELSSNIFACGDCYRACNNGEACIGGQCQYGTCVNGGTFCEGYSDAGYYYSGCVTDFSTDWSHCGTCGNQCGDYESCENGRCVQPSCEGYCYSDAGNECNYIFCQNNGGCTDVATDVQNCGACAQTCTGSQSLFWWDSYTCSRGTCGCSALATPCGPGCATRFPYCPPSGYTGSELDLCNTQARNAYDRCGCANCLNEIRACAASATCINAMDCSLWDPCVGCSETFYSCSDNFGQTDALADSLVACLNRSCAMP